MANSDKTEKPTQRRRQKAREKGQVARSRDVSASLAVGAAVVLLGVQVPAFVASWRGLLRLSLDAAVHGDLQNSAILLIRPGLVVVQACAVPFVLCWMAAAAGALSQGGMVFAPSGLTPNLSRLSPATRLEQLFSLPSLGRLLKSLIPGAAIACVTVAVIRRDWADLLALASFPATGIATYGMGRMFEIAWKSSLILLVWAGVDYLIERRRLESDLRMSRQDLVDEYKETEGHPTVKARLRRLRRQVQRRRMLEEVKRASVVITNPNEFAVALEYRTDMPAPTVIAKGRNLLAQQIKQAARWHGIPLIENPPLAHALYRAVEVGQSIPPKLYAVVAAILAAIYRAQERAMGKAGG